MYKHKLQLFQNENEFDESLNDYVYKHIVYALFTLKTDPETNANTATTTRGVLYFDEVDSNNFIPSANVDLNILTQWVEQKVNIAELQQINIQKLEQLS
jgi:hypothetical protein